MEYFNVWKKIVGVDNSTDAIVNNEKNLVVREFKNDPSYRSATLFKLNLEECPIDIRLKNVDRTTSEKRIIFLPETQIEVGSFIKYDDKVFLLKEFECDTISPYSKGLLCNQTLNWYGLSSPIPCWCDNSSYGTKGVVDTNLLTEYDGKILFYTQYNENTAKIRQDMRFIFDNAINAVYRVVDINRVVTGNVLRLVMDKTEFRDGFDDIENNIAYNDFLMNNESSTPNQGYTIKSHNGLYHINRWDRNEFKVYAENGEEDKGVWDISLDYRGNSNDIVKIISKTSNSLLLENNGVVNKEIELLFSKDELEIRQIVRLVK